MADKWLAKTDFMWCAGCPASWIAVTLSSILTELKLDPKSTWMISGIGCTGRMANYFSSHTAHTTHGRAIPVAEGIKLADFKKGVFVVSGDGDILSIGLSHLIHTARRNTPIKVICVNNALYSMTGGQTSPTTPKAGKTKTHSAGSPYLPIQPQDILASFPNAYFARSVVYDRKHFSQVVKKAYHHPGFAFIELVSFCRVNDPLFKEAENINQSIKEFLEKVELRG